jgi:hypothetical protein
MMSYEDDDAFDERGILKDGHRFRVEHRMLDSLQRSVAQHAHQRDSTGPVRIVDQYGSPLGLNKPGWRREVGGNQGDALVRDGQQREIDAAYAAYDHYITMAFRAQDNDNDEDEELAGREAAIHSALVSAGGSPDDVTEYLEGLDDDELMAGDLGYHLSSFRSRYYSQDAARRARDRLERLYQARDRELSSQWRK